MSCVVEWDICLENLLIQAIIGPELVVTGLAKKRGTDQLAASLLSCASHEHLHQLCWQGEIPREIPSEIGGAVAGADNINEIYL